MVPTDGSSNGTAPESARNGRRALLIDSDAGCRDELVVALGRDGFAVETIVDASRVMGAGSGDYDLVVMDLELPHVSGTDVLRSLRASGRVPIIVVTALGAEADKVRALELGADDYVTKPFSTAELVSRIHALNRRCELERASAGQVLEAAGLRIDLHRHEISVDGRVVYFTGAQYRLLSLLVERAGAIVTRREMMERLWNGSAVGDEHVCDVHVSNIRQKIERHPSHPVRLVTIRGEGYRLSTTC